MGGCWAIKDTAARAWHRAGNWRARDTRVHLQLPPVRGSGRITVLGLNLNNHRFTSVVAREPLHGTSAPVAHPARHRPLRPGCSGSPLGLPRQPSYLAASCRRARCGPSSVERYFPPWAPRLCPGCVRGCVRGVARCKCGEPSRGPRQRGAVLVNLGGRAGERTTASLRTNTTFGLCPPPT